MRVTGPLSHTDAVFGEDDAGHVVHTRIFVASTGKDLVQTMHSFLGGEMRKMLAAVVAGSMLLVGGVACDDNKAQDGSIDEDDSRLGPGDGEDEVGPGR